MLEWRTHWVELIGKSLYTAPQAECAPRVDAYAFKCDGRLWVVTDPAVAMRWQAQGFEVTPVERADAEKDAALTDKQLDAAIEAWFSDAIIDCGQRVRMRAAILAANKEPQP
jgi:hypothetical protein